MNTNKMSFEVLGQYQALTLAVQQACVLLSEYINVHPNKSYNVVFDIDDTLIFDDSRGTPNIQIKHLLEVARAYGCKIRLVTAREKDPEVMKWTRSELKKQGIHYDSLSLAPKSARVSMAAVAKWKSKERSKFKPVLLTVGDQWGDIVVIHDDEDIDAFNHKFDTFEMPWAIIRPNDGISMFGLKLMA